MSTKNKRILSNSNSSLDSKPKRKREQEANTTNTTTSNTTTSNTTTTPNTTTNDFRSESTNSGSFQQFGVSSIPTRSVIPHLPRTLDEKINQGRLIVILDNACLETVKIGNEYQLLNCDDHVGILKRNNRDIKEVRPDITHQCLLTLLDSPINKAGLLQVYIRTARNVLIEVHPQIRIPRTFKRFAGLMVQLLHKLSIRAADGPHKLLKIIKNPITDHLPVGAIKIGASFKAKECVALQNYIPQFASLNQPIVFVIGAFAHGKITADYIEKEIAFSYYPLSASVACGKVCDAFEYCWGIL
eukprot:TRINITY_DN4116_c0_g1_i2.p1 TRINITY_DN4116_c0_g1~~TRINITY_DN4116_c0_g1_i2.p1  ORF type:complete len:300 (-),score=132.67 TRINITY_DN4116_c0_g1_i2:229-1128(-)